MLSRNIIIFETFFISTILFIARKCFLHNLVKIEHAFNDDLSAHRIYLMKSSYVAENLGKKRRHFLISIFVRTSDLKRNNLNFFTLISFSLSLGFYNVIYII